MKDLRNAPDNFYEVEIRAIAEQGAHYNRGLLLVMAEWRAMDFAGSVAGVWMEKHNQDQ